MCANKNCGGCSNPLQTYVIVGTRTAMRAIPCGDRVNGMIVSVVSEDFKFYQLQGGDICNNNNWIEVELGGGTLECPCEDPEPIVLHYTLGKAELPPSIEEFTDTFLNNLFPEAPEGFKVTCDAYDVTAFKVANNTWRFFRTYGSIRDLLYSESR